MSSGCLCARVLCIAFSGFWGRFEGPMAGLSAFFGAISANFDRLWAVSDVRRDVSEIFRPQIFGLLGNIQLTEHQKGFS